MMTHDRTPRPDVDHKHFLDPDEMTGAVWEKRVRNYKHSPHYVGACRINGMLLEVAVWRKTSRRTGKPFLGLAFRKHPKANGEGRRP
jgi:hypothetical protein